MTRRPRPGEDPAAGLEVIARGALAVDPAGRIAGRGPADALRHRWPDAPVIDHGHALLLPGFVDAHLHFPQLDIIGCWGEDLLGWLDRHVFPAEAAFADADLAARAAARFVTALLAAGVTAAAIFSSSHLDATDRLLREIDARGLRAIVGKLSMDRHAPPPLLRPPHVDIPEIRQLIDRWHGRADRIQIALTPRFVPTCSPRLLRALGDLARERPDLPVQTHWAETEAEIDRVRRLHPRALDYLELYEQAGLVRPRALLGHGVHPTPRELERLAPRGATVVHCPLANRFLGAGLFPLARYRAAGVAVALGSDVGAGTSFSPWRVMLAAYEVQRRQGLTLHPVELLDLATLAGAAAIGLEDQIGNFATGKRADFIVIDPSRHPLLAARANASRDPADRLFALIALGDERLTRATYLDGNRAWAASTDE
ncbi:MAG TPA: guanine deaminase [Candidatus Sumerlaeota bacterium]|nr:guanine deaminase [Candidatus Sumerlaeota bacterium]